MKTILLKLFPGVAACVAVCALIGWSRAQAPATVTVPGAAPAVASQPIQYATYPQPGQVIVCGHCGNQIAAPQTVLVAMPVGVANPQRAAFPSRYGRSEVYAADYCPADDYRPGAPPQSIFPLSTQWRIPASELVRHRHTIDCDRNCRY